LPGISEAFCTYGNGPVDAQSIYSGVIFRTRTDVFLLGDANEFLPGRFAAIMWTIVRGWPVHMQVIPSRNPGNSLKCNAL
jgi:hypothetical protein